MSPLSPFLAELGRHLESIGHEVWYAAESRLPLAKYAIALSAKERISFLSDYCRVSHPCEGVPDDIGRIMFSNFDRDLELGLFRKGYYGEHIARQLYSYFLNIFNGRKFDTVIYENVSNSFAYAAYLAAQSVGVQYLGLIGSRIPGRFEIWKHPYGIQREIGRRMNCKEFSTEAVEFAEQTLRSVSQQMPDYMRSNPFSYKVSYTAHYLRKLKGVRTLLAPIFDRKVREDTKHCLQTSPLLTQMWAALKRNYRRKYVLRRLDRILENPIAGEKYLIYPLHYHPESSTSVLSPEYVNEEILIKNLAFNLPNGVVLYVKDHPNAAGFKNLEFYEAIQRLPNVRLIHYRASVDALISKSEGVVTLTSTLGYEALLSKKRVYVLGEAFYTQHPLCRRIICPSELTSAYRAASSVETEELDDINKTFVAAYYMSTYAGRLHLAGASADRASAVESVARGIVEASKLTSCSKSVVPH